MTEVSAIQAICMDKLEGLKVEAWMLAIHAVSLEPRMLVVVVVAGRRRSVPVCYALKLGDQTGEEFRKERILDCVLFIEKVVLEMDNLFC